MSPTTSPRVRARLDRRLTLVAALLWPATAGAAGGADVVDDPFVETPGVCHIESWYVAPLDGGSLAHLGIGCTPKAIHRLELDAAVERVTGGGTTELFEPGFKYTLLVIGKLSLGTEFTAALDRRGRFGGASLFVPLSYALGKYTIVNLDIGAQRGAAADGGRDALYWGGQIAQAFAPHFAAIGEVFGDNRHTPGVQGGLRWSPGPERFDFDLRASHGPDHAGTALTFGLTWRT
ncbi:MAG: hypothetical protein JOY99_07925 [Sphingomonadaceae bacterium]|nr:hypothetical protein [Sphingomonadaceae bacterium]